MQTVLAETRDPSPPLCTVCKWPTHGGDHPQCSNQRHFLSRGRVVTEAAALALQATAEGGLGSDRCNIPLLHLSAPAGFGKTTIGWAIRREIEARRPNRVLSVYFDLSSGDALSDAPLEEALCLGITGKLFYGKCAQEMVQTKVVRQRLTLTAVLMALAKHWRATASDPVLLVIHFDESQELKQQQLSRVLSLLWAWTGRSQPYIAKAELNHLYIVPLLTGTVAPDLTSTYWGVHSLLPLVDVLSIDQANTLVSRRFPLDEFESSSHARRVCTEWMQSLNLIIRSSMHLPGLLAYVCVSW